MPEFIKSAKRPEDFPDSSSEIIFIVSGQASSPFRYLTSGVDRSTAEGMHSEDEYPGTRRYSPKVRDGSSKK